ncbi:sugar phosphate isomerase/epimerase [Methylocystis sp. WRRC1]|uniref:sugar phosphate isomerase/epimerase family protein n=1 Tax=Methylocystis sp. WRRC1 TaxID=1732014 RepID=UPI001D1392AB|nr:TIM barrel protein [Methylocystis sp. WRRC1]MCC3246258.1 sugar phosphate isomerase/epimerase [Methylocystis sp. WRRC1]
MRVAISNLAWDADEDDLIAPLLARFGIDAIDIAPGKYFSDPGRASDADISRLRNFWRDHGVEIIGAQALLFGATNLNIFGAPESQRATLERLSAVSRIAAGLGATRLVFGSIRNRNRAHLGDQAAFDMAVSFFRRLAMIAQSWGVFICLEPIPSRYGSNFLTTTVEAARMVLAVNERTIRLQLDTGTIAVNREDPAAVVSDFASIIGHVHASEPDLAPLGAGDADHAGTARALARHLPEQVVTVEFLATENEPHESAVARSLSIAVRQYREI